MTRKVFKGKKRKTIKRHLLKKTKRKTNLKTKAMTKRRVHKKKYVGGDPENIKKIRDLFNNLFKDKVMNVTDRDEIIMKIQNELTEIKPHDNLNTAPLVKFLTNINKINIEVFNNKKFKETLKDLIKSLIDKCDRSNFKKGRNVNFGPVSFSSNDNDIYNFQERELRRKEEREEELQRKQEEVFGFDEDFIDDFYSRNATYDANNNRGLRLKQFYNNYTLIETTQDGNCFYNAYFQLAHRFKSNANLLPFTPYDGETVCDRMNEVEWVNCFKIELAKRIINGSDNELNKALNIVFTGLLTIHLKEYYYNFIDVNMPNKSKYIYEYQKILDSSQSDFDKNQDGKMIEAFTKKLPNLLNHDKSIILLLIALLNSINELKEDEENEEKITKELKKENAIDEFIATNVDFKPIKEEILKQFREGLTEKLKISFAYATSIEISIIQTFINLKYERDKKINEDDDKNMIPIINVLGPNIFNISAIKNELDDNEMKRRFIFYKTGPTGRHYDAVFSEVAAPEIPGSPEDKIFTGPKVLDDFIKNSAGIYEPRLSSSRATSPSRGTATSSSNRATIKDPYGSFDPYESFIKEPYRFEEDIDYSLFE